MQIGLLQCDHVAARFQARAGDYPQMFGALFERFAPEHTLVPFDVCNDVWPASLDACDAYLCTGSRWSVYDDIAWIHTLKQFVRQARDADKPFVGICFGHQMLAEALGGKVEKAATGWGVGVQAVEFFQTESWMQPPQTRLRLQYMHQDQVLRLPDEAVVLGHSSHCPNAVLRIGTTLLGIQAHPEFTAAYGTALLHDRRERIGTQKVEQALASLRQPTDAELATSWIAHFLAQALQKRI
jgi:GMP synthase-like glutamine amidotransferase